MTKPYSSLTLHNVLYILEFPINPLSIRTITHTLNCVTIFFLFHCILLDIHSAQRIGLGHENGLVESMS